MMAITTSNSIRVKAFLKDIILNYFFVIIS
jgi:hypothetical protein